MSETGTTLDSFPVFALDMKNLNALVQYVGRINLQPGIMSYIYIASHEYGHQLAFSMPGICNEQPNGSVFGSNLHVDYTDPQSPVVYFDNNGQLEPESDLLNSTWKAGHHLNPNSSYTTLLSAYPGASPWDIAKDKPDSELVADITALGLLLDPNNKKLWQKDWSDGGLQCYTNSIGNIPLTDWPKGFLAGTGAKPDLYFNFTPVDPTGTFGLSTPVFTVTDIQNIIDSSK